jgi:hypothetical protein
MRHAQIKSTALQKLVLLTSILGSILAAQSSWAQTQADTTSQYRAEMPSVAVPKQQVPPDAANQEKWRAFSNWSRSLGAPKLLVFWNRSFTDQTSTMSLENGALNSNNSAETNSALSRRLEASVVTTLIDAGGNIVNRDALMRKVSTQQTLIDRLDQNYMEALATQQGIVYAIEVDINQTSDNSVSSKFNVKITHIVSSRIVAQFETSATPGAGPSRWVAGVGGFSKQRTTNLSAEAIGMELAIEIMERISRQ